jgi:hypothetical protein
MNNAEMVTGFRIGRDWYETPMGTFPDYQAAADTCTKSDLCPETCVTRKREMVTVKDLIAALCSYCGSLAEEYEFCVSPSIAYDATPTTVPERFLHLIAYAVEGGSEGYYVHVGAILRDFDAALTRPYLDFGFAKTWTAESAYALAKEAQRFLSATIWN